MKYVDLGLTSGTRWADTNREWCNARDISSKLIPTRAQFEELFRECEVEMCEEGARLTGKTGNSIILPIEAYGVPVFDLLHPADDPKKPRGYRAEHNGKGYYRTKDWKDNHNIVFWFNEQKFGALMSENTYKFSIRTAK